MGSSDQFETKTSSDDVTYECRSVPTSVNLDFVDYPGRADLSGVGGYPVHHLYVKCNEVSSEKLPLEANPREPSKTPQVEAMQNTLVNEPTEFVKKNNGVVILCDSVEKDSNGGATISFKNDEGVCNGGHTYFAMLTCEEDISDKAAVHIEAIEIPDDLRGDERKERIIEIARARNNNNRLERRSEADFLGYYDKFKQAIGDPNIVSWHEGDSIAHNNAIDAVHFIRLVKSLDVFAYRHPIYNKGAGHHKSLAVSRSRVHSSWLDRMDKSLKSDDVRPPLYYLVPKANTVLWFRDLISHSLKYDDLGSGFRKTSFYQEYIGNKTRNLFFDDFEHSVGTELRGTLEVLFIGLLRSNLYIQPTSENEIKFTGWYIEPKELWNRRKVGVLSDMANYFQEVDSDPKQFIRVSAPFEKDLYKLGIQQSPPAPSQVHNIESGIAFKRVEESDIEEATHWYRQKESENTEMIEIENLDDVPRNAPLYKSGGH